MFQPCENSGAREASCLEEEPTVSMEDVTPSLELNPTVVLGQEEPPRGSYGPAK